jgi:hypothetical protein
MVIGDLYEPKTVCHILKFLLWVVNRKPYIKESLIQAIPTAPFEKKNEAPFNHPFHTNVQEWMVVVVEDSWLPLLINACLRAQVCSTQHRRCLPLYVGAQHLRGATLSCQDKVLAVTPQKF